MNKLLNQEISFLDYTFFAILACVLGVNFSIQLGGIQLSLYRLMLLVSFLFLLLPAYNRIKLMDHENGILFIQFLFFWFCYSLIAGFWVVDYLSWMKNIIFLGSGLVFSLIIIANIDSLEAFQKAMKIVVYVSMAMSILAFYESITGNYFFLNEDYLEWYSEYSLLSKVTMFREPITVFGNPNNYALFLFFSFCFTLYLLLIESNLWLKILYVLFLLTTIFLIAISLSRSALLGVLIVSFFTLIMAFFRGSDSVRRLTFYILLVLVGIGIQVVVSYAYFFDGLLMLEFDTEGSSDSIRRGLLVNGFDILKSTFFIGTGLGNVEHYMAMKRSFELGGIVNLHNWWMEILVSSGVVVFIAYVALYLYNTVFLWKRIQITNGPKLFWLNCVFTGLSIGFIISSIGPSSLIGCEWLWPLMALTFKATSITNC
jgi:teichuronic acid biosynthesis protein TuaE